MEKDVIYFGNNSAKEDGLYVWCKKCVNEYGKKYRIEHSKDIHRRNKEYYEKDKTKFSERMKKHNSKPENKVQKKQYKQKYYSNEENREKRRTYERTYQTERRKNDIQYKIGVYLRVRLRKAVKRGSKVGSAVRDLGCSIEEFKIYIENQFMEGQSWENWGNKDGDWSLDHIKPLHLFDLTNREELLQACHYTNLRPLWHVDNISRTYEEFK
jgi:hypothetical protein